MFVLHPRGPYSLDPIRGMACGFLRGSRVCSGADDDVRLAFPLDGSFAIAGARLRDAGGAIRGEAFGGDAATVRAQVARTLAVDVDAEPFAALVARDPVLRRHSTPGFRPVVAYSPYVMAGWAVLSQRLRMAQAAAIQVRIAEAAGDVIDIDGVTVASFPGPETLLRRRGFPGVNDEKWTRLQAVARAALDGELERGRLLALPYPEARERLLRIRGVGPWSADAILIRGCGPTDALPLSEPMLHGAVAIAYDLPHVPDDDEVRAIAESWRPFRTWVSVMLIAADFAGARQAVMQRGRGARPKVATNP